MFFSTGNSALLTERPGGIAFDSPRSLREQRNASLMCFYYVMVANASHSARKLRQAEFSPQEMQIAHRSNIAENAGPVSVGG